MNVPVFIDITYEEQAEELRAYFKGLGADISAERSADGLEEDLSKIIAVCETSFTAPEATETDVEGIMNGIVSMLALCSGDKNESLVLAFCEKLSKAPTTDMGLVAMKVLWTLYQSFGANSILRYHVYYYLVGLAGKTGQLDTVFTDMATTREMFRTCEPALTTEQLQKLYRLLHEVLLAAGRSEEAGQVMVELLSTFTMENASQAREEAQRCIVASLADPNTFLFDHLLSLKPVKCLAGEPIHNLLNIFVSEKLEAYIKFYESNKSFVEGLGLKHEDNLRKMKLLSFMQLAENRSEITFEEIQTSIQIKEDEVEEFMMDVITTKLVRAKLAQDNGLVYVSSTMHRTFGPGEWQQLHQLLKSWKNNIHTVKDQMHHVASAQIDLMHKKI